MKLSKKVIEKINEYYKSCIVKYHYHLKAAENYQTLYLYTTAPIIIFSSITTVLASYSSNIVSQDLAIAVAVFSGLTTIGQALVSFVEYNTKYAIHFSISNKFKNLSRMIETEVAVNYFNAMDEPNDENTTKEYVKYLFNKIYTEFINIQEIEPYLPMLLSPNKYLELIDGTRQIKLISDELAENNTLISDTIIDMMDIA
jgi:energy-converting hydrogenase Eha subunit E